MRVTSGRVVAGKIVLDDHISDGTDVTVLVPDENEFELDAESEAVLLEAMAQADRGEVV